MSAATKDDPTRRTYSIDEVARMLGVGRNLVYRSAKDGELAGISVKLGSRIVIPREAFHRLLREGTPEEVNGHATR